MQRQLALDLVLHRRIARAWKAYQASTGRDAITLSRRCANLHDSLLAYLTGEPIGLPTSTTTIQLPARHIA